MRIAGVALDGLVTLLAIAGCLCLFGLTGLILGDVVGRGAGLFSIPWKIDVAQYLLYLATFLAAPWVLREGAHVSVDLIVSLLPPRAADVLSRLAAMLGALISLALVYYGYLATEQSRSAGTKIYKSIIFPEWYTFIPVPLTFALTFLIFVQAFWRGAPDGRERNMNTGA